MYNCAELMAMIANWNSWYGIEVRGWIFLEAGEAKTTIDSHHAQIAHSIKRYVRLGNDISEGEDIVNAIKDIRETSVANIQPNRNQREIKKLKIDGGTEQSRPNPIVSTYTNPTSEWIISLPSNSSNPNRLSVMNLKKELDQRNVIYNNKENRFDLVTKLQTNIQKEIINNIDETKIRHELYEQIYKDKAITSEIQKGKKKQEKRKTNEIRSNYFCSGWALKENQKYGKKGGGKHMTKAVKELLKIFFHTGDENKTDEIPQLKTIENWISRYSSQHKKSSAKRAKNTLL
ncbi:hypothetical protein Glove_134g146 [Diversispora epigaea]|uniref:Uncharacterized protein n=1 Tax=Diversispora epigaea TaxID=1348612 RepID=A0A397IZR0_9GLOM|nr:hypothetical protein Glove_134g146 [Diversispora epigaea]